MRTLVDTRQIESLLKTRDELLQLVWGYREAPVTRAVDSFIFRLRRKIEPDPHHPRYIRTAHGGGYRPHSRGVIAVGVAYCSSYSRR
jgi:DNA-binding winged helix-turn-helix (wHTH) protein